MPKSQKAFRGWVMVVRDRTHPSANDPDIYPSGKRIQVELVDSQPEFFRRVIEVYGDYDVVVQTESDSLEGLHRQVMLINRVGGVRSTTTLVAATKGGEIKHSDSPQAVIRIRTQSDRLEVGDTGVLTHLNQ